MPPTTGATYVLADAVKQGAAADRDHFDRARHRGRLNLVFADGHVEARALTDLRDVKLR